jgi:hypothetical protein
VEWSENNGNEDAAIDVSQSPCTQVSQQFKRMRVNELSENEQY